MTISTDLLTITLEMFSTHTSASSDLSTGREVEVPTNAPLNLHIRFVLAADKE